MSRVTCHMSMSLDGFVAGPEQSQENPLGIGGIQVHHWHLEPEGMHEADAAATAELLRPMGAYVMGRNSMFDGIPLVSLIQREVTHSPVALHVHYEVS